MKANRDKYKWGIIYFNRSDSRIFVPKLLSGTGWTLNFARPESYLIIVLLILFIIVITNTFN